MRQVFGLCCVISAVLSLTLTAQQAPVQGPAPNDVLKPVPAPESNWRHALAAPTAPEIAMESARNFLKLPTGLYLGETMGVATNSKGQIYTFTRSGENSRLFQFAPDGTFQREIGRYSYAFAMAHAVRVDAQDFIWTVDEGTNTVIKWDPETYRPVMILGRRHESAEGLIPTLAPVPPPTPYAFNRPSDVAFDAQGNIFVGDGYNNSRAVKYDKNGRFVASTVGTRGPLPNQMNLVHGIAVDNAGNVYVADRNNGRIQVFSNDLTLRAIHEHVGSPWALCITPGPHQYLYSSNSNPDQNLSDVAAVTGQIFKMELDGTVVGKFGKPGKAIGEFGTVHAIDCRNENQVIVSEITNWRAQKLTLKPAAATRTSTAR